MDDLFTDNGWWVLEFHWIPPISFKRDVKTWWFTIAIVVSIHESRSDQKLYFATCEFYGVTISYSFREASHIWKLPVKGFTFVFRWYIMVYTSIYEGCISNVIYARYLIGVARISFCPTIYAYKTWER